MTESILGALSQISDYMIARSPERERKLEILGYNSDELVEKKLKEIEKCKK